MSSDVLRPLSDYEAVLVRLGDIAPINFTMISRVRGPLNEDALQEAIAACQKRHPLLSVNIARKAQGWSYSTSGVPDLALNVIDAREDELSQIVERELEERIDWSVGPLARFVLVRHSFGLQHLLITFHHVIGDAIAGADLMRQVLQHAAACSVELSPPRFDHGSSALPIDDRLPRATKGLAGAWRMLLFVLGVFCDDLRFGKPATIRPDADALLAKRWTRVIRREFDEGVTTALVERCRSMGTTVHGALSATVCLAIAADQAGEQTISVKHRSPVNLRDRLTPPAHDEIGLFAAMAFFRGRISSKDDFWEVARAVSDQIHCQVAADRPGTFVRILPRVFSLVGGARLSDEALATRWRKQTATTTGLTNIGRIDFESGVDSIHIESLHFAVAPGPIGDFTTTVTTFAGKLRINLMCPTQVFSAERAYALADDVTGRIEQALLD
jgi:NRPS condensation-like uncharacterized protein